MNKMTTTRRRLYTDNRGANLVEYIILVGVIALVGLAGASVFGSSVSSKFGEQADAVSKIPGGSQP